MIEVPHHDEEHANGLTSKRTVGVLSLLFVGALMVFTVPSTASNLRGASKITNTISSSSDADAGSNADAAAEPIMLYCTHHIKPDHRVQYKATFAAFATMMQQGVPGIKAMFSFMDKKNPLLALQVSWFEDEAAFLAQSTVAGHAGASAALWATYDAKSTDVCEVYGGSSSAIVSHASGAAAVRVVLHPRLAGYMKPAVAGSTPPVFIVNTRRIQHGASTACAAGMESMAEWWRASVPGLLGASMSVDEADPQMVHEICVTADLPSFVAHQPQHGGGLHLGAWSARCYDNRTVAFSFRPDGVIFAEDADEVVALRQPFTPYSYTNGLIGPKPDFS